MGDVRDCLPSSDVLCFQLSRDAEPIRVGRAPGNTIVVNDATISL